MPQRGDSHDASIVPGRQSGHNPSDGLLPCVVTIPPGRWAGLCASALLAYFNICRLRRPAGFLQRGERPARKSDRQADTLAGCRGWRPDTLGRSPAPSGGDGLPRTGRDFQGRRAGATLRVTSTDTMRIGDLGSRIWLPMEEVSRRTATGGVDSLGEGTGLRGMTRRLAYPERLFPNLQSVGYAPKSRAAAKNT